MKKPNLTEYSQCPPADHRPGRHRVDERGGARRRPGDQLERGHAGRRAPGGGHLRVRRGAAVNKFEQFICYLCYHENCVDR